jgi:SAM-dependent methyltransferase
MRADRERWNRKYLDGDGSVHLGGEPELVAHHGVVPCSGLALELACGKGENALYLASLGYDVVAADISIEGLKICTREASRIGLQLLPVALDLDQYTLPQGQFELVSVVRYLNRALFNPLINALRPGGLLFYKTFNLRHLRDQPNFNPAYVLEDGELSASLGALDIIAQSEQGASSYVLGRKV